MEKIKLIEIIKKGKRIEYKYECTDGLRKYLNGTLFCQYNIEVKDVPDSIAAIPFISNVLPFIWLTDSKIEVEELDSEYFACVNEVRGGMKRCIPCFISTVNYW